MKFLSILFICLFFFQNILFSQQDWIKIPGTFQYLSIITPEVGYEGHNKRPHAYHPDYHGGSESYVNRSIDGMYSFENIFYTGAADFGPSYIGPPYFFTESSGFVVRYYLASTSLFRTRDGGKSWSEINIYLEDYSLFFTDENNGYLFIGMGRYSSYIYAFDSIHPEGILRSNVSPFTNQMHSWGRYLPQTLYFINDSTGFMTGNYSPRIAITSSSQVPPCLYRTNDWGRGWDSVYSNGSNYISEIHFFNESVGVAVGDSGHIIRTTDGGISWDQVNNSFSNDFFDLDIAENNIAYITGSSGIIGRSADYGISWTTLKSPTVLDITYIKAFSGDTLYIKDTEGNLFANFNVENTSYDPGLITFFPNPNYQGYLMLDIPATVFNFEVDIYDLAGRKMIHSTNERYISTTDLITGVYLVNISCPEKTTSRKLIHYAE